MAVTAKFLADFTSFQQAVQKAELSLKSFETGAGKVEKSLNKIGDSFSGKKVIQDAELMAKAIGGIEGASKLTEAEQRRVNATLTEALAKYKALGLEAPAHMTALAKATAEVQRTTSLAEKAAGVLRSGFGQFTAANLAASAIGAVTDKVVEFASKGAQLRGLESSFSNLSAGIKQDSGAMLSTLQANTRGLVANFDLLTSANKAMLLGLPVTTDTMGELAKTATVLGRAMGQDATKSLDDLITALGRSSPLILDNLGLTVKVGEANEAYAKKLGITVEQMTEAQKKLAFYEAAMEAARKKTAELGDQTLTLSERLGQFWVSIENTVTKRASQMNVVLGKATESWRDFFGFIKDAAQFKSWDELAKKLEKPRTTGLPFIDPNALARESKVYQEEMAAVDKAFDQSKQKAKQHAEAIGDLRDELSGKGTIQAAKDMAAAIGGMRDQAGRALPVWRLTRDEQDRVNKAMEDALDVYRAQGIEAPRSIQQIAAATFDYAKLVPTIKEGAAGFEAVGRQAKMAVPEVIALYGAIRDGMPKVVTGVDNLNLPGAVDLGKLKKLFDGSEGDIALKAGLDFGKRMSQGILSAIQGGGSVSKTVGAQFGEEMGTWAGEGLAKSLAAHMPKKLAGAIGGILGPLGAVGGELLGGLVGKLFGKGEGRSMVEDFAKQFGGFSQLNQKLVGLGQAEYDRLWKLLNTVGKNNTDQAKRAIDEVTAALERQNAEIHKTAPSFADASAAAEALGLDINRIGDGINQLRVSDTAKDIAANWAVLRDAGADMEQVARGASDKFQKLVDEALKWGHTLPEEMREPLQKMIDLGLLTDKSGDKLQDLSGIKWAEPMEKAVDRLIGKMDQLIDRIGNGLGGALSSLPDRLGDGFVPDEGTGRVDVSSENSFAAGTRGFKWFGSGTRAMLHGWEAVIRPGDVRQGGSGQSAGTVILQVGTRELVRTLMPEIAGEVKRLRLGA